MVAGFKYNRGKPIMVDKRPELQGVGLEPKTCSKEANLAWSPSAFIRVGCGGRRHEVGVMLASLVTWLCAIPEDEP
ncbi:unnamed protein product [Clonostachys solani]|uniref:Uncharacterized protein n=1 Tax=Clonostachys solani TaxID=160281 RepID=A0A9N9ZAH4_9HYPO|nr:unnamed protein product [Clonostachys solani]